MVLSLPLLALAMAGFWEGKRWARRRAVHSVPIVDPVMNLREQAAGAPEPLVAPFALSCSEGVARLRRDPSRPQWVRIEVHQPTELDWQVYVRRHALDLVKGNHYRLSFRARADAPRPLGVVLMNDQPPWKDLGLSTRVELRNDWGAYQFDFIAKDDERHGRIQWQGGGSTVSWEIDGASLIRIEPNPTSAAPAIKPP